MSSCVDEKQCYSTQDPNSTTCYKKKPSSSCGGRKKALGSRRKPTPSKWDDAQKWLVALSTGGNGNDDAKPRDSNADDRRLLAGPPGPHKGGRGRDSCSSIEEGLAAGLLINPFFSSSSSAEIEYKEEEETKKIDMAAVRSVCLRDMGTEMTPVASKEPSRSATPLRARSPAGVRSTPTLAYSGSTSPTAEAAAERSAATVETSCANDGKSTSLLETRASAWDEAERTKYMARYKREEVKIQAWENHQRMKAEMAMKKMEVKAERLKNRATEKLASKMASTRRVAEEKRSSAEAKLSERGARTSERADYIRRTGRLPSSFFSFKLPSMCN